MVTRGLVCARINRCPERREWAKAGYNATIAQLMAPSLQMQLGTSNPVLRMAETQVSIRIDLESGRTNWPGKDRSVRSDPQNRIDQGSRLIDANVLSQSVYTGGRAKSS